MADLGRVEPMYGRWRWPFHVMQAGDEFWVSALDREPEDVRRLAGVRAAQLGIRLETHKADDGSRMHVRRIAYDENKSAPKVFDYPKVRLLLREEYGLDADAVPWGKAIERGERFSYPAMRKSEGRGLVEAQVGDQRYAVELLEDRIVATCLGQGETLEGWKKARIADMLA
jgi:hypothetical protein